MLDTCRKCGAEFDEMSPICPACFSSRAERSGAPQACLPSTTGSASAAPSVQEAPCGMGAHDVSKTSNTGKEDEAGVDNSVVQLPVSVLLASLIQNFELREKTAQKQRDHWEDEGKQSTANEWENRRQCWHIAVRELKAIARSAPSAAGASGGS